MSYPNGLCGALSGVGGLHGVRAGSPTSAVVAGRFAAGWRPLLFRCFFIYLFVEGVHDVVQAIVNDLAVTSVCLVDLVIRHSPSISDLSFSGLGLH